MSLSRTEILAKEIVEMVACHNKGEVVLESLSNSSSVS
jgi:hypothetical protein